MCASSVECHYVPRRQSQDGPGTNTNTHKVILASFFGSEWGWWRHIAALPMWRKHTARLERRDRPEHARFKVRETLRQKPAFGMKATGKVSVSFRLASLFCPVESERSALSVECCWLIWLRLSEGCHTIQLSGPAERTGFPSAPLALPICH